MKHERVIIILFIVLIAIHVISLDRAGAEKKKLPAADGVSFAIPSPILKISSLEFKGLVSDLLFLKAIVFYGSTYDRKERLRVTAWEWQWFNQELYAATDLDPYFFDPYFTANAIMTWEGGMVRETNALLEKGTQYRDWDWMLPFFIGFNNFFFLHDNAKAAGFLMKASERPGGPSEQLASLAARLEFKEKKTENAILFLEAIAKKTEDQRLKKEYETRIRALRARLLLERSVAAYKRKFGLFPASLEQLVKMGMIKELPQDPYGGKFSIAKGGEISVTTDYLLMPGQR